MCVCSLMSCEYVCVREREMILDSRNPASDRHQFITVKYFIFLSFQTLLSVLVNPNYPENLYFVGRAIGNITRKIKYIHTVNKPALLSLVAVL